ncbi:MAG: hypothetical protein CMP64_02495 [Flavobacteriales bacterium]|nr:hypothetical protein [Flavobacteriales bacterium]
MKKIILYKLLFLSLTGFTQSIKEKKTKSAKKASILSAVLPGAGQIYNKKYWKVPIIYSSLATGIYFICDNQKKLTNFEDAYIFRSNGGNDNYINLYNNTQLISIIDYYERNRDISYIITAAIYLLNIVDASVDAHLFDFDISEDLSIETKPQIINTLQGKTQALSIKMNF